MSVFYFTKTHISPKFLARKFKLASNEAAYLIRSPNTKKSVKLRISSAGSAVIRFLNVYTYSGPSTLQCFLFKIIKFRTTLVCA